MDILQELPVEKWPLLQKKLERLWPLNVPGYSTLYLHLKYPKIREEFQFKVYCPHGDIKNGFVGTNFNGTQDVILFSVSEDTSALEEALVKTKIIDWNSNVCIDLVTSLTLPSIERVKNKIGFSTYVVGMAKMYLLERNTKLFTDLRLPANTYAASVKQEHIDRVNDTWPYKHSSSHFFFTVLSSNGLSYGLYSLEHELLAWVFVNDYNFLCHLYCGESHRRKGLAEYLLKWAVNEQLSQGNDVYAYVVLGNEKPVALFEKTGFKIVDDAAFLYVQK